MRRRAVIFDDNDLIRFTLWHLFDQRGYEVFTFPEPGMCPLHVVQECPCHGDSSCADLIVTDVNMHASNGIDFLDQLIRKGCKQRKFALMSATFSVDDQARAQKRGRKLFTKPLNMREFVAWVEETERAILSDRTLYDWA